MALNTTFRVADRVGFTITHSVGVKKSNRFCLVFRTHEAFDHLASFYCHVNRRFHSRESKRQPLHLVLGTAPLSSSSVRSSWALKTTSTLWMDGGWWNKLCLLGCGWENIVFNEASKWGVKSLKLTRLCWEFTLNWSGQEQSQVPKSGLVTKSGLVIIGLFACECDVFI